MAQVQKQMQPFAEARGASWDELMTLAFGVMRLSPDIFWDMTPREFAAASKPFVRNVDALSRASLNALMSVFPDQQL
jgi:uncharacterized phage protein (TIGR02216 family)